MLVARVPWDADTDPDDIHFANMTWETHDFTTDLRIQPVIGTSGSSTRARRAFAAYRGASPDGDVQNGGHGLVHIFEGPGAGSYVGAGPVTFLDSGGGTAIALGSPAANGGAGAVAFFAPDASLSYWVSGAQGSALGAALTPLVDVHDSGQVVMFAGAPGGSQSPGALYALPMTFELLDTGIVGVASGDRVGLSVVWRARVDDTIDLFLGAPGMHDPNAQWSGSWILYE